jgi:transcriptional regulator with XRE-family HTH domain
MANTLACVDWGWHVSLGQEVKRLREAQNLSLSDLARLSGVAKGYLSEIENELAPRPSADTLFKLASALGVSAVELRGDPPASASSQQLDIPESLRIFARRDHLPASEVRMLAGIKYRGRSPQTPDDWRYIYESIRLRTQGR